MLKKFCIVIAVCLSIVVVYSFAVSSNIEKRKSDELYRQVRLFSDALAIIQKEYVEETIPKDLIYGSLRGMLSSLDHHSQFLDPDTYNELMVDTEGKFGGLGIEITIKDGLLTVISPLQDTPAWKAGIKSNDRIVKINNEITRDISLTDAMKKLRGKPGEMVTLTILRESEKKILEFKLVRDMIKIKDIKDARILEDSIGYIRVARFSAHTIRDFDEAKDFLKKEGMSALILDLRNNPGGPLEASVNLAERFIEKGKTVVSMQGRPSSRKSTFVSHWSKPIINLPMVVLINQGSASASEIIAGCLQDYRRAIILGEKSFGKGSVQTVIPLSDGSALKLTTNKYLTPLGKQIHGKGVIPDIVVEEGVIDLASIKKGDFEAEKKEGIFEEIEKKGKPAKIEKEFNYKTDNQLMRAVDILKALRIYKEDSAKVSIESKK